MPPAVTNKDKKEIRFNSGNLFLVKLGSGAWEGLGNILGGKLSLKSSEVSAVLADGETVSARGSRKCNFSVSLAQTNKTVLDRLMALSGENVQAYYYNGVANSKYQEIFIPSLEVIEDIELDMKGQQHQSVMLVGTVNPTDLSTNVAVCTPDTDLPDEGKATGATAIESDNPYFVILETAVV